MTPFTIFSIVITTIYVAGLYLFFVGLFFPRAGQSTKRPFISVIIAARNEEKNIGNCLKAISQQTYPFELFEVIVVSDNSIDKTDEIILTYSQQYSNIRLLRIDGIPDGITPKKNAIRQGIYASSGEIILTTDADCIVKSTWIEKMVSYFTDEVGMVVGFSQFGEKGQQQSLLENLQALDFLSLMSSAAGSSNVGWPLAASGQNLAYRRCVFDEVGGFARIGHRVSGDDVLLLQLVNKKTNWKIVFAADAGTYNVTRPEKTLKRLINQRTRWASNGPFQILLNLPFFVYILNAFLMNLLVLGGGMLALSGLISIKFILTILLLKILSEFVITIKGAFDFQRVDLLKFFPLWMLLQIPYVVLVGILGSWGNFSWKDRSHGIFRQYLKWGEIEKKS
ncbi:glycosyltransferase [candidate division KSB1 bacterium]|nr:glycosyltransferase [candidate division KSB1 bacterium]